MHYKIICIVGIPFEITVFLEAKICAISIHYLKHWRMLIGLVQALNCVTLIDITNKYNSYS